MNVTTISTGTTTEPDDESEQKTYKIEMIDDGNISLASDDDEDDLISSDGSLYGDGDLEHLAVQEDLANQLAAAGPVGVAAAAAIASSKKRKRPHCFETNPSVRKRQQNRLLRKLRGIIYEFTGRVGKQAVVLVATPGKPNTSYKVFGAKPLEDVVRNLKNIVMDELENALAQQAPPPPQEDPSLFELPPLIIDGIPTPVEKMTQAQLRAFIPLMLKYSTGRGKPGWGRESTRPPWWPKELPWANVRMDARSEDDKQKISWTHALRKIVINCYKYHGREDLLPTFADDEVKVNQLMRQASEEEEEEEEALEDNISMQDVESVNTHSHNYSTQTVFSTIQNADGTVSLIQVDPNNPIITLPDGTTAQVQGVATLHQGEGGTTIQTVQSLTDVNGHENMTVDLTEATVAQDGQIYITAEDGQGYPVSVSNMITVPVSASMYQSMMANIQQIHTNNDGTVCITPMQVDSHNNNSSNNNNNNQYQCYSILSTAPGFTSAAAARLIAAHQTQTQPPTIANHTQTNNDDNNLDRNSSSVNNSNTDTNNIRCQIISQTNLSNNSSRQQQNAINKIFIAGNALNFANGNNTNILNLNNNNNHKFVNAATVLPIPIVVATGANLSNLSSLATFTTPPTSTSSTTVAAVKRKFKRRKKSFSKVIPIKLEDSSSDELRNGEIGREDCNNSSTSTKANAITSQESWASKVIKLERIDN